MFELNENDNIGRLISICFTSVSARNIIEENFFLLRDQGSVLQKFSEREFHLNTVFTALKIRYAILNTTEKAQREI